MAKTSRFTVSAATGNEQLSLFTSASPTTLAYVTIENHGPRAMRVYWDLATGTQPSSTSAQSAPLGVGNALSLAIGASLLVAYAPDLDPNAIGDHACGTFEIDHCCPVLSTSGSATVVNEPPKVAITAPKGGLQTSPVRIAYTLTDRESDPARIEVSYSLDAGKTFQPATEAQAASSDGVDNLQTSPTGHHHIFAWDAASDLHGQAAKGVIVRIIAYEPAPSAAAYSKPFDVGQVVAPIVVPLGPLPTTGLPNIQIFKPLDDIGSPVPVRFLVADAESQLVDVDVEVDTGSGFQTATLGPTSDQTSRLPAPFCQADYRLLWDGLSDTGAKPAQVTLRMIPKRGGVAGSPTITQFHFDPTTYQPKPYKAKVAIDAKMQITGGSGQSGICGTYLKDRLEVQVTSKGRPLVDVFVGFTAFINNKQDGATSIATTDNDGKVSCALFCAKEAGAGKVEARIIGVPSQVQTFNYPVKATKILANPYSSATPQAYVGYPYVVSVICDQYEDLPLGDVQLAITAKSGKGSDPVIVEDVPFVQGMAFSPFRTWNFRLIALEPDDTIDVDIKSKNDPSLAPLHFQLKVAELTGRRRTGKTTYSPYGLKLVPAATPAATTKTPLVGFYDMTLQQAFKVSLVDPNSKPLTLEAQSNLTGTCSSPTTRTLNVTWSLLDGGGTISDSPQPGKDSVFSWPIDKPVYITPGANSYHDGQRAWLLVAEVKSDAVLDPKPQQFIDPTTHACDSDNVFNGTIDAVYAFIIRKPKIELTKGSGSKKQTVQSLKAGDRVQLELSGLSPATAASPLPTIQMVANGGDLRSFTGTPKLPATQALLAMTRAAPDRLTSPEILITQGDPQIKTHSKIELGTCPDGSITLTCAAGETLLVAPVEDTRKFERRHSGPYLGSMQESPTATTPLGGAADSIVLRNGEFFYHTTDLSVSTRAAPLSVIRSFRGQVKSNGPFGPGWFFNLGQYLYVARDLNIRPWLGSDGRYDELWVGRDLRKGLFLNYRQNNSFDKDSGPYQVTDPGKTDVYFNVDGSLRLAKDRLGNFTRYTYDENAHLVAVQDCHGRTLTIDYWKDGDPVSKEAYGKIKRITDYTSRVVDYQYYGQGDPDGSPGWLKSASFAEKEGSTVLRSETYKYQPSSDSLDIQLLRIADTSGQDWVVNRYDGDHRVLEQDYGKGTFHFKYDLVALTTEVTDRAGSKVVWTFPESPYPDGAAPAHCTIQSNRKVRPNDKSYDYELAHNSDGNLVYVKMPQGDEWQQTWDEDGYDARQRGNLQARRHIAPNAPARVWSWLYSAEFTYQPPIEYFDQVILSIDSRGHAPGENPKMYETTYLYDYDVARLNDPDLVASSVRGDLLAVLEPRATYLVVGADPSQFLASVNMIESNAKHVFTYNPFGLIASYKDPQGVVTDYKYYPDQTPTAGTLDVSGGGFLGRTERDTTPNDRRDKQYLVGIPYEVRKTEWTYDPLGRVQQITDNADNKVTLGFNPLDQLESVKGPSGSAKSPNQPKQIARSYEYTPTGTLKKSKLLQPGQLDSAGGPFLAATYDLDPLENIKGASSTVTAGNDAATAFGRDANDAVTDIFGPDISGLCPSSGQNITRDDRGLPYLLHLGTAPTAPGMTVSSAVTAETSWNDAGELLQFKPHGQSPYDHASDPFGAPRATVDPMGNVVSHVLDSVGAPTRTAVQRGEGAANESARSPDPDTANAPLLAFNERRAGEDGTTRRTHNGAFVPATPGGQTSQTPPAPEYLGTGKWSPVVGEALPSGRWGPDTLRASQDTMFDAWHLPTRIMDDELACTLIRRDSHARPIEVTQLCGSDSKGFDVMRRLNIVYDKAGHATDLTVTDFHTGLMQPKSYPMKRDYDDAGRIVRTIDGEGNAMRVEYDETGHAYALFDAMGPDSTELFNKLKVNGDGNKTTRQRNGLGLVTHSESELNVGGIGGGGKDTKNGDGLVSGDWEYSPERRPRSFTDHLKHKAEWGYDDYGRAKTLTLEGKVVFTIEYQPGTNRIYHTTDANGSTLEFAYDDKDRVISVTVITLGSGVGGTSGYKYEHQGNVTITTELGKAGSITRTYDSLGRLHVEDNYGLQVTSLHDGLGRRRILTLPGGTIGLNYVRDTAGRLRSLVLGKSQTLAAFEYMGPHRVIRRDQGSLIFHYVHSDGAGRLMDTQVVGLGGPHGSGTIEHKLARDRMNRITSDTRTDYGVTETKVWVYDSAGRILQETNTTPRAPAPLLTTRGFDGDTVLVGETRDIVDPSGAPNQVSTIWQRAERGRITGKTGASLQYDKNGNIVFDGSQQYVYDAFNRLIEVSDVGALGPKAQFEYDAFHRCTSRTLLPSAAHPNGLREEYLYDELWQLLEVRVGGRVRERYHYTDENDDIALFEIIDAAGTSKSYCLLYTPEGWVDAVVDPQGVFVERYDYDLSGRPFVLEQKGQLKVDASKKPVQPMSRFLFQRRPYDKECGLYQYRMRWYSPELGFFLTPDPAGFAAGPNHYGLCSGDPVNREDRFGLEGDDRPTSGFVTSKPPPAPRHGDTIASSLFFSSAGAGFLYGMFVDTVENLPKNAWEGTKEAASAGAGAVVSGFNKFRDGYLDFQDDVIDTVWGFIGAPIHAKRNAQDLLAAIDRMDARNEEMAHASIDRQIRLAQANRLEYVNKVLPNAASLAANTMMTVDLISMAPGLIGSIESGAARLRARFAQEVEEGAGTHEVLFMHGDETMRIRSAMSAPEKGYTGDLSVLHGEDFGKPLTTRDGQLIDKAMIRRQAWASKGTHTELKALVYARIRNLDGTITMHGRLAPCEACARKIWNFVDERGNTVIYTWKELGGGLGSVTVGRVGGEVRVDAVGTMKPAARRAFRLE